MKEREQFKSRIGFILLSAGCAIGIGNVWRFPYVVGENGGGIFVLFFLIFLIFISFHVYGLINNNIGNNSSLPANISKIITILERFEYIEKFPVGPTILSPGPILFNVATTAVKLLVKSKLSIEMISTENISTNAYAII